MKTGIVSAALVASLAASANAMKVEIGNISYEPATDVTASLATSASACEFKKVLDADAGTLWEDLKKAYEGSDVQKAATSVDDNDFWKMQSTYFGGDDFLDKEIMSAISGTDGYAKMEDSKGARMEGAQKYALDHVAVKQVMKYVFLALDGPDKSDAAKTLELWDHAFASYFGKDLKCAVYARANKRGKNYGTKNADNIANANTDVLTAFIEGATALRGSDGDAFQAAAEKVSNNVMVTYIQAALRYLYLLDVDVVDSKATSDHHGEGRAFWKIMEPTYAEDNKNDAAFKAINTAYDLAVKPAGTTRYCTGEPFLFGKAPEGVTKAMLGEFEYHTKWKCPEGSKIGEAAPPAATPAATPAAEAPTSSATRLAMGMAIVLPVLAAMM